MILRIWRVKYCKASRAVERLSASQSYIIIIHTVFSSTHRYSYRLKLIEVNTLIYFHLECLELRNSEVNTTIIVQELTQRRNVIHKHNYIQVIDFKAYNDENGSLSYCCPSSQMLSLLFCFMFSLCSTVSILTSDVGFVALSGTFTICCHSR